jgi:hypothetical protein
MKSSILEKTSYFESEMGANETQTGLDNFLKYLNDNEFKNFQSTKKSIKQGHKFLYQQNTKKTFKPNFKKKTEGHNKLLNKDGTNDGTTKYSHRHTMSSN